MKPQLTSIRKFTDSLALMNPSNLKHIDCDDFAIIKIEELGMQLPYQSSAYRPDHFSIIAVFDGNARYLVGDNVFDLQTNQILFACPDTFLSSKWSNLGSAYSITFKKQFLSKYWPAAIDKFQRLDDAKGYTISLTDDNVKYFESVCLEMYGEAVSNAPYKYDLVANLLLNLLMLIYQQKPKGRAVAPEQKYNPYTAAFLREMENNFSRIAARETTTLLRIKDYASMQNLNENYLSKIVSSTTGKTVNQWIHEKLINEIKYLLKHTDKPMLEIATIYGFDDLNYFYSYFKRHTQNAPGFLRKNVASTGSYEELAKS